MTILKGEKSPVTDRAKKLSSDTSVTKSIKSGHDTRFLHGDKIGNDPSSVNMCREKSTNVDPLCHMARTLDCDGCVGMDNDDTKWSLFDWS